MNEPTLSVDVVRLDDCDAARGAVLLKIDVEGHEADVLAGAEALLASSSLLAVLVEDNDPGHSPGSVRARLQAAGFRSYAYDPYARSLTVSPVASGVNVLFVRNLDDVRARIESAPHRTVAGVEL